MSEITYFFSLTTVTILFFASLQITNSLVVPLQQWLDLDASFAAILFLPHGVRVVSVYILGPISGFFHLLFAVVFLEIILNFQYAADPRLYLGIVLGAAVAPVAYILTKFFVGTKYLTLENVNYRTWRIILLVCFLSAVINSLGQSMLVYIFENQANSVTLVLKYMIGDFAGALTIFLLIMFLFRKLERKVQ